MSSPIPRASTPVPPACLSRRPTAFKSKITLHKEEKTADAKRIFAVMGLIAKKDQPIVVTVEGEDEEMAAKAIKAFLKANL